MILETERLILRPFTESDAADAFEYLHEPMVHCFACMKSETVSSLAPKSLALLVLLATVPSIISLSPQSR